MINNRDSLIALGTETLWGKVVAVGITGGERYYWMIDKHGDVAMMPAIVVEESLDKKPNVGLI